MMEEEKKSECKEWEKNNIYAKVEIADTEHTHSQTHDEKSTHNDDCQSI